MEVNANTPVNLSTTKLATENKEESKVKASEAETKEASTADTVTLSEEAKKISEEEATPTAYRGGGGVRR